MKKKKTRDEKLRDLVEHAVEIIQTRLDAAFYVFLWGMSIKNDRAIDKLEFIEAFLYELDLATRLLKKAQGRLKRLSKITTI